jgi:hypothetical protein
MGIADIAREAARRLVDGTVNTVIGVVEAPRRAVDQYQRDKYTHGDGFFSWRREGKAELAQPTPTVRPGERGPDGIDRTYQVSGVNAEGIIEYAQVNAVSAADASAQARDLWAEEMDEPAEVTDGRIESKQWGVTDPNAGERKPGEALREVYITAASDVTPGPHEASVSEVYAADEQAYQHPADATSSDGSARYRNPDNVNNQPPADFSWGPNGEPRNWDPASRSWETDPAWDGANRVDDEVTEACDRAHSAAREAMEAEYAGGDSGVRFDDRPVWQRQGETREESHVFVRD